MALYITLSHFNTHELDIEWHVGQVIPTGWGERTVMVQADGDELLYLWNRFNFVREHSRIDVNPKKIGMFENMPRVVRYFGDDAKFIVGNLV